MVQRGVILAQTRRPLGEFLRLLAAHVPKVTTDGIVIDVAAAGGRPLQTTLSEKKQARVHDRIMELLVDVQRRVFETATPDKIVDLFKLGEGNPPALGIKTADVVDGFYSFLASLQ